MTEVFNYGKELISLTIPAGYVTLENREPELTVSKRQFLQELLSVLPDVRDRYLNVGIVVSDKTRLCGYPKYLPWVIEALKKKGTHKTNITFYIAYGTHASQNDEESINSYGEEVFTNYPFVHHNCNAEHAFCNLGLTKRGTEVNLLKEITDCSLLLTFGAISYHYFAGYGGGRKLLFPGLASYESIYHNHSLFLDRENEILHTKCQPGILQGNPVAEDLKEIDHLMPPKVSIHALLNSKGVVCKLLVGDHYKDFENACNEHDKYYKSGIDKQYDMVVASCGGYPKDINFIQAHKALHYASAFVKDGGKLILLAECIDSIGSETFLKYLEPGSFEKAFAMLKDNYEGNGGTALSLISKTGRIKIYLYTSLDEHYCRLLRVRKISENDIFSILGSHKGSIAVIKNASMLVK